MKLKVILTVISIFLIEGLQAQLPTQSIRGRVIDHDSRMPLVGATVSILKTTPIVGTATNIDGKFRLDKIPIGRISLKVTYLGYESKVIHNIEVNSAKQTILDISLIESVVNINEVLITATSNHTEELNEMALVSKHSISAEQTSRFAGGFNDPSKITSNFAGIASTADGGNEIIVRGNSPKYVKWRLEGAEITNPNHFGDPNAISGIVGALNNNLLSTSDFYTAAFPAEFGDALSGVYDVRMRKGNNEKFEAIFGLGLLGTDITVEGPLKKGYDGSFLANFRYSSIGLASQLNLVDVENVDIQFQDAAFKFWLPTDQFGTFSVFGLQGNSGLFIHDVDPSVWVTPGNDYAQQSEVKEQYDKNADLLNVGANHFINLNKNSYIRTTLSYSREGAKDKVHENIERATSSIERLNYDSELRRSAYRLNSVYHLKVNARHKVSTGFQFASLHQKMDQTSLNANNRRQPIINFNEHLNSLRSYISWKYLLNPKLTFVGGIHNTNVFYNQKHTLEPRLASKYKLNSTSFISAGFGIHSKMESVHNYFVSLIDQQGNATQPNLNLGLLKAAHYVFSYEKFYANIWRFKTELYYQDLYNIPVENNFNSSYTTLNEGLELNYVELVNEGSGKNYGVELTLERLMKRGVYFMFNASLYQSKYTALDAVERNTRYNGNYLINLLSGKEFNRLGKRGNQTFALNLKSYFGGGRYYVPLRRNEEGEVDVDVENDLVFDQKKAYQAKFDDLINLTISLSYKWNKPQTTHEVYMNIDNLTNNQVRLREYYDESEPNGVAYERQVGVTPNLLYRVYF